MQGKNRSSLAERGEKGGELPFVETSRTEMRKASQDPTIDKGGHPGRIDSTASQRKKSSNRVKEERGRKKRSPFGSWAEFPRQAAFNASRGQGLWKHHTRVTGSALWREKEGGKFPLCRFDKQA